MTKVIQIEAVEAVKRPRYEHGCDYNVERLVLARLGTKELQWAYAHKYWLRRGEFEHTPGALVLTQVAKGIYHQSKTIHDSGGRLSKKLLLEHTKTINDFFACEIALRLHPQKTLIISIERTPSKKRCKGHLYLENLARLLIRRDDNRIHGYCIECQQPVALRRARRTCNRLVEVGK